METYKIVRIYKAVNKKSRVIKKGLTLEEAKAHCKNPKTCTKEYFDGFDKE